MKTVPLVAVLIGVVGALFFFLRFKLKNRVRLGSIKTAISANAEGKNVTIENEPISIRQDNHPPDEPIQRIPNGTYRPVADIGSPTIIKM